MTAREVLIDEIVAELDRAIAKFPEWPTDPLHAVAVIGEEFGELTKAVLQHTYEPHKSTGADVRTEAIQTAAMAVRFVANLDAYRFQCCEQAARAYLAPPEPQDDVERELAWARAYRSKNEQYVAYDALVAINEKLSHELAESYERAAQACEPLIIAGCTCVACNELREIIVEIRALKGKPLNQEE
jgi:NTP pyrophosphatase (non-canonical NTP hydrolase)